MSSHVGPWRPGWREEFMLTAHLSCPPAHCSRNSGSEQTSHTTTSNFILGFIFAVRALHAPLHHFSYESWKKCQLQLHSSTPAGPGTYLCSHSPRPGTPACWEGIRGAGGQRCARGRPARRWAKELSRQQGTRFHPPLLPPRCL